MAEDPGGGSVGFLGVRRFGWGIMGRLGLVGLLDFFVWNILRAEGFAMELRDDLLGCFGGLAG